MEKSSDKRIVYAIGIIGIISIFFVVSTFASPFLLKISSETKLDSFLFFMNRSFMWLALLLLWLYAKRVEKKSLLLWSKRKRKILFSILAIFAILLVIFLGIFLGNMLISKILSYFPTSTNITSPKLLEYGTLFRHNIPLLIFTAATAAIVEELVFRGYIQPRIEVIFKNPIWGIIGSALLFALLHLSYDSWLQIIGPLFIGLVLSIFYWKYRNIKILIICHFVIDLIGLFSLINVH